MSETALFLLGFVLLLFGGDSLMRGSAGLGRAAGLKAATAGWVLVGFVVSIPQLVVLSYAQARGLGELALGNAIGGGLASLGLVLGVAALCAPLAPAMRLLAPLAVITAIAAALLLFFGYDGSLARWEGGVLLAAYVLALGFMLRHGPGEAAPVQAQMADLAETSTNFSQNVVRVAIAAGLLFFAGRWIAQGAPTVAAMLGLDLLATGSTVVAAGTAVPALVLAVICALRLNANIVLALAFGACLGNLLLLPGLLAAWQPIAFDAMPMRVALPAVAVAAALLHLLLRRGLRIGRREGLLLLLAFVAFVAVEIARAWR